MARRNRDKKSFADLERAERSFDRRQKSRAKRAKETGRTAIENNNEYYEW